MASPDLKILAGVIEGFYGPPWSQAERLELFEWMAEWGLNTYLYAPKDDLKHRALWREVYSASEAEILAELVHACGQRNIRFIYALSPGLDIRYHEDSELELLRKRFEQIASLGCRNFALLFDDIPGQISNEDFKRFGSVASAQCQISNLVFQWVRERCPDARFLFCPTPYCGRLAERKLGGEGYLPAIGRELSAGIDILWTGPEIISREIALDHVREVQDVLRRKPLIWDNLYANDYDGRRFYCGPYSGRTLELCPEVAGLLINPNTEFALNFVPVRTFAAFLHCVGTWNPRQAYLSAMSEWSPRFATVAEAAAFEDLILFGDCYYLPHAEGTGAETLYECVRRLLAANPDKWNATEVAACRAQLERLHTFCGLMADLRHRPLFYALSRRIWELREELELLDRYLQFKSSAPPLSGPFASDFHLAGTYRGGMVSRLQQLLDQHPDGTLTPARKPAYTPGHSADTGALS